MPCPGEEGGRDWRPRCRGDVEEGVAGGAGGWAAKSRGRDTGEVDAQREPGLFQSFLWHGEGLQLLLSVGHVRVLAAAADTVQTRLSTTTTVNNNIHDKYVMTKDYLITKGICFKDQHRALNMNQLLGA